MTTVAFTKAVSSTINAVVRVNFPLTACFPFFIDLDAVVLGDTLPVSRNLNQQILCILFVLKT